MTEETSELDILKERANKLGIKYHPKIGVDSLRKKVNATLNNDTPIEVEAEASSTVTESVSITKTTGKETENTRRRRLKQEANKLIRVRITCMNPNKKEWEGEIVTVSNAVVGTIKKYVPFNAEEGWHIPQFIYNVMKAKKCQVFQSVRDSKGEKHMKGKLINEFNIEILPPLTEKELEELSRKQALGKNID